MYLNHRSTLSEEGVDHGSVQRRFNAGESLGSPLSSLMPIKCGTIAYDIVSHPPAESMAVYEVLDAGENNGSQVDVDDLLEAD